MLHWLEVNTGRVSQGAGGIFGGDRLGGAGMTACFVMGREAGRQAAARAKELKAAA